MFSSSNITYFIGCHRFFRKASPVIRVVASWPALIGRQIRERVFFHCGSGVEVDLCGLDMWAVQPQRDGGARRAGVCSGVTVPVEEVLRAIDSKSFASSFGEQGIIKTPVTLAQRL